MGGSRFLPPAQRHAVPRRRARGALARDPALLSPEPSAYTPLLRGAVDMAGQGPHPCRQAACPRRARAAGDAGDDVAVGTKSAAVIGAGFGGLALAIRLQ